MDDNRDEKQAAYEARRAEMLRLMQRHLGAGSTTGELADDACVSRFHFQRVFRNVMGEAPGSLQRRLRLERAAYDLRHTRSDVTSIALDAGYASREGFSRAFRRAYGHTPSAYRVAQGNPHRATIGGLVHYDPQTSTLRLFTNLGGNPMDLVDRLLDNDYRSKRRLLESALPMTDAQLDMLLPFRIMQQPWLEPDRTIRETLLRLTDMVWVSELLTTIQWPYTGEGWRDAAPHSVQEMIDRLDCFQKEYAPFVYHVKENNLWETKWVDSGCDPAETFTYATVIEYGIEGGIFRRFIAERLLGQAGIALKR